MLDNCLAYSLELDFHQMNNKFMRLLKSGSLGSLCRRAAWIVALLGIAQVVMLIYSYLSYSNDRQLLQQGAYQTLFVLPNFSNMLANIGGTIFYALLLYVAGTLLNAFFVPLDEEKKEDDDTTMRIEPLDEVEITSLDR